MANDFAGMKAQFRALFAGIPSEWRTRNEIARYEGYYASVFYACLAALGQLRARGYAEKYRGRSEPIHLIGVEFSEATKSVDCTPATEH